MTVSDVKAGWANYSNKSLVGSTTSLPLLDKHLKMNKIELPVNIKTCIIEHLEIVSAEFRSYFKTTHRCMFHGTETCLTLKLTYCRRSRGVGRVQSFECNEAGI